MNNNQNIPKLRFKGFDGEWKNCKLSDSIASLDAGVSVNSDDYPVMEGELGVLKTSCVSQGFFNQKQNKVVKNEIEIKRLREPVRKETIIISRMNTPDLVGASAVVWSDIPNLFLPDRLWSAKIRKYSSVGFLGQYLASKKTRYRISARATGTSNSMKNVSKGDIFTLKIDLPNFGEQQKIASFLGKVDEWIGNLKQQKENLEKYKKGMMQKFFAQKIRFKNENGKDFLEWKNEKLAEVIYEVKKEKEENPQKLQLLTVKLHNNGITASGKFPSVTEKGRPYYKRYLGELLIGRQNFHNGGFGFVYKETNGLIASNAISSFLFNEYTHPKFIYYLISRESFYKRIANLIGGTGQKEISCNEIMKIKIQLPEFEEQQKISEFLTSIDKLIDSKQEQIAKAEEWKKGLIQGLFV